MKRDHGAATTMIICNNNEKCHCIVEKETYVSSLLLNTMNMVINIFVRRESLPSYIKHYKGDIIKKSRKTGDQEGRKIKLKRKMRLLSCWTTKNEQGETRLQKWLLLCGKLARIFIHDTHVKLQVLEANQREVWQVGTCLALLLVVYYVHLIQSTVVPHFPGKVIQSSRFLDLYSKNCLWADPCGQKNFLCTVAFFLGDYWTSWHLFSTSLEIASVRKDKGRNKMIMNVNLEFTFLFVLVCFCAVVIIISQFAWNYELNSM